MSKLCPTERLTTELQPLAEVEREHILRALRELGGNITAAAKQLGIDRRTLYRKLDGYGHEFRGTPDCPLCGARAANHVCAEEGAQ